MAISRRDAFPKGPWTGKTPFHGKISPPCIQNQLILARYALHVCKMLCKMPSGNAFREYLATKTLFSVRIPQIMHSRQILPLLFDLSFVRELCDSCLCGSSGRDRHHGSTFTGVLACPLREGASAVARPLCGAQASPFALYAKVQALRLVPYVGVPTLWFAFCAGMPARQEKTARRRKALSLARPSRSAFLSGNSWHYFVAMHSQKGASVRQRKATGRGTPSRTRRRLRGC